MALHQPSSSIKQHIVTVFRDQEGTEIHSTVYSEEVTRLPDGSVVTEKNAENYALASGELTNPSQAVALPVGVCALCGATPSILPWQRSPTTRLCSMEHLKHCASCGRPLCPRHRKRSEKDRKWRCLACHRKHWWAGPLSPLFFEETEE